MKEKNILLEFVKNTFCLRHRVNARVGDEYHLTAMEVDMINYLYLNAGDATATDIERERNLKKNTISVHIDHLVKMGLVERFDREDDRRKVRLSLTEDAREIAQKSCAASEALKEKLIRGLSREDLQAMLRYLETINDNAEALLNEI